MKKLFIASFCILLAMTLSGCGKKTLTEKSMEKVLEDSMGGQANVEVDNDSIKIETNQGTMEVSSNGELPENWPDDIYVTAGDITSASSHDNGIFNLSIETDESVSDMQAKYEEELKASGWGINMTFAIEDSVLIGAEKDDRSVSITIGVDDEKTLIVIGTGKQ